jgi:two-component system NtrC family sensor kinase
VALLGQYSSLEEAKVAFSKLFESIIVGLALTDPDRKILSCNDTFLRMLGKKSTSEVSGQTLASFAMTETARYAESPVAISARDASRQYQIEVRTEKDHFRSLLVSESPVVDVHSELSGMLIVMLDVTKNADALRMLRESEERYRRLFDHLSHPAGIFDAETGDVDDVNEALANMLGYERQDLYSMNATDISAEPDSTMATISSLYGSGKGLLVVPERPMKHKNGKIILAEIRESEFQWDGRSKVIATFTDITERRRAERAVVESEQKFRGVVENAGEGILIIRNGAVVYSNPRMGKMTNYLAEELSGISVADLVHPDSRQQVMTNHSRRGTGKDAPTEYQLRALRKDGTTFWAQTNIVTIDWEGELAALVFLTDITGRRAAEEALQESEERFRVIADSAYDGIILLDSETRVTFWSKTSSKIFGYTEEEILGHHLFEKIAPTHDLDYTQWIIKGQSTDSRLDSGQTVELEAVASDGTVIPVELSANAMKLRGNLCSVVIVRDISERRAREEAYARTVSQYMAMINTVPAMMFLKDAEGKFVIANESFCASVRKPLPAIIGRTNLDLLTPDQAARLSEFEHAAANSEKAESHDETSVDEDGNERWYSTTLVPVRDKTGTMTGTVGLSQDVTELRVSRQKLAQSDKLAAIGTLAAGVAHEINNPIGFISSNLNTMSKYVKKIQSFVGEQDSEQNPEIADLNEMLADFADAINESMEGTGRVKKIVADLKSFSRVDRSQKEYVNLNDGIESTLNIVWNELKYKCTVQKDFGEIPDLYCIPNQLNQVFLNLLMNAGDSIQKEPGEIKIRTWSKDGSIFVSITDNGSGIKKEAMGKIFEAFYTTKEVGKGTGLGLSLAYDIVKKHRGTIDVKSEVGVGSEFTIRLPIEGIEKDG